MAVTITGAKYAIRSLTAVGTTTVTIGTGTFVSGDFGATQRMVSLFTSAGIFKGIAWVRQFTSTTVLQLENQFVDPITGLYATQVVGDQILVSKNSAESATTGFTVTTPDTNVVTVSDNILMGNGGDNISLCFYDEHKQFTMTNGFRFNGGVAVFGKLMSYDGVSKESFIWSRECTARPNDNYPLEGSPAYNLWGTGGTAAHMFFFGGAMGSPMRRSFFIGAQATGATNKSFAFYGTRIYHAAASPNNGGNWASDPDRHLLYKTIHEADYSNANLIVWGNGAFQGSFLSFPQFGAGTPLGIFRASGAVNFGASANNRTIVNDTGSGAFIDDINNGTYVFTNLITPFVTILRHPGGSTPIEFRFSDDYTNLKNRTTLVIQRAVDNVIAASVVNTLNSVFTATVVQAIYNGTTNGTISPTNFYTAFNYTIKCYGFNVVNGTHTAYTYSLGAAGNGTDLKLGGLINQLADAGVTLTEAVALTKAPSYTINTTTKKITVTNTTLELFLEELYDYTVAWGCASAANATVPNLAQYLFKNEGTKLILAENWNLEIAAGTELSKGPKFKEVVLTGTGLLTNNGTIDFPFTDALGSRVAVTGLDPENFGVTWNVRYKKVSETEWTELTGTGNSTTILTDTAEYNLQARVAGYTWKTIQFNTSETLAISLDLAYHVADDGTPQYLKSFNSTLVDAFEYNDAEMEVEVTNTTGEILQPGFPELYRVVEKVQQDPTLVWQWVNPVTTNATSQKVLIPPTSPLRMYLSTDSDASVKITCPVVYSDTGISADDRVKGNPAGFSIILGSSATADSSLIVSQLVEQLGGVGFNPETHSLTKIQTKVAKNLTKTQFLALD